MIIAFFEAGQRLIDLFELEGVSARAINML